MATLTMDIRATCDVVVPEHLAERLVPAINAAASQMESERMRDGRRTIEPVDFAQPGDQVCDGPCFVACAACGTMLDAEYQHVDPRGVVRCMVCARGLPTIDDAGVGIGGGAC